MTAIQRITCFAVAAGMLPAQAPKQAPMRVGNSVLPPSVLSRVEPEYSPQAGEIGLQGRVLISIVINEQGRPENIEVVSPLGFWLDERAIRPVEQ